MNDAATTRQTADNSFALFVALSSALNRCPEIAIGDAVIRDAGGQWVTIERKSWNSASGRISLELAVIQLRAWIGSTPIFTACAAA